MMFPSDGLVWGQSEGHDEEFVLPIYGGFVRVHGRLRLCGRRAGHLCQCPLNKLLLRIAVHRRHTLHLARKRETESEKRWRRRVRDIKTSCEDREQLEDKASNRASLHYEPFGHENTVWKPLQRLYISHMKLSFSLNAVWRLLLWSTRRQCHEFRAAINDYCHN